MGTGFPCGQCLRHMFCTESLSESTCTCNMQSRISSPKHHGCVVGEAKGFSTLPWVLCVRP